MAPQVTDLFGTGDALFIRGILTPAENAALLAECRQYKLESLESGYDREYRNNTRVIIKTLSAATQALLFDRVRSYVPGTISVAQLRLVELNSWYRFCRYEAGGVFGKHYDATNAYKTATGVDRRSRWTVMFYLNSAFEGGETRFYKRCGKLPLRLPTDPQGAHFIADVQGEAGSCVIFDQSYLHEGLVVRALANDATEKLILRTDAMYEASAPRDTY